VPARPAFPDGRPGSADQVTGTVRWLSNELLAEAQLLLFRGLRRLAVINSYQAVESLANIVFKEKKVAQLMAAGKPQADAEREAERERGLNRTRIAHLVHNGLLAACKRSLHNVSKEKYDNLLTLKQLRNKVAHAGTRPTPEEAEAAHLLCCEVVQWLCRVGGLPVRPLLPDNKDMAPGLQASLHDANAVSSMGTEFLRQVLGLKKG
jgi:hypothetical protein